MTSKQMLDEAIELLANAAPGLHICYPVQSNDLLAGLAKRNGWSDECGWEDGSPERRWSGMSRLTVTVCYLGENDTPFICAVNGPVTTGALNEIEGEVQSFEDDVFEDGPGDYTFSVNRDPGESDEYGRWIHAPYWDLSLELFSDHQNKVEQG